VTNVEPSRRGIYMPLAPSGQNVLTRERKWPNDRGRDLTNTGMTAFRGRPGKSRPKHRPGKLWPSAVPRRAIDHPSRLSLRWGGILFLPI
jgi:hypothetical protein